jgi:hypothetical protein
MTSCYLKKEDFRGRGIFSGGRNTNTSFITFLIILFVSIIIISLVFLIKNIYNM